MDQWLIETKAKLPGKNNAYDPQKPAILTGAVGIGSIELDFERGFECRNIMMCFTFLHAG